MLKIAQLKTLQAAEITLTQAAETHLRAISVNKTERTRLQYRYWLARFVSDVGNRPLSDLQPAHLLDWAISLDGLSPYTAASYIQAVKRFFAWLHQWDILPLDLAGALTRPRLPRGNRTGISDAHAQAILDAARDHSPRDYAILTFLDSTACRRSGLADLRLSDIDLTATLPARRRARVREKGHPARTVLLDDTALEALSAWLSVRPVGDTDHVFLSQPPGRPPAPLQPESIRSIINRYAARLGIQGPVSPHQWRHRTSRRLIRAGLPMKTVAQLNGHSVLVCERYYSDLTEDDLLDQFEHIAG